MQLWRYGWGQVTSFGLAKAVLVKSVAMPIQNFGAVIRIFAIPTALYAACSACALWLGKSGFELDYEESQIFLSILLAFGLAFGGLLILVWGVVGWHRYVLNEGPATWFTPVGVRNFVRYILDSFAITLLLVLIGLPVLFILSSVLSAAQAYTAVAILSTLANLLIFWIFLRLSPLLPSSAIDKRTGLGGAWRATSKGRLALLWVAVVWLVMNHLVTRALGSLGMAQLTPEGNPGVFMAAQMVLLAILGMWGVSLITTIYGYFVEDRAL